MYREYIFDAARREASIFNEINTRALSLYYIFVYFQQPHAHFSALAAFNDALASHSGPHTSQYGQISATPSHNFISPDAKLI